MNTIFRIKDPTGTTLPFTTEVEGVGQETASIALKTYKGKQVILAGFLKSDHTFIPIKL